ncbi:uncharacterized protein LOC111116826 [Crassostrea virginica]
MSSTLDSRPNVVETDSAPNLFAKRVSPVQSSKIRNTARLVLEKNPYESSSVGGSSDVLMTVKNISPPSVLRNSEMWKYPEYTNFATRYASFS